MKLSSVLLGAILTVAVFSVLLLVFGVRFERPLPGQGAALYNPANEMVLQGVVQDTRDFACPVSEGEIGDHLMVKTANGIVRVHLAPGRIMRSNKLSFAPGEQIEIIGAKLRYLGADDIIAREIIRGNETFIFRDHEGKLMLVQ
jgi:hypothetical protein